MKVAIMQPYFLPYLGYFQLMAAADKFVVYDDVQFIVGGWINRNRILVNGKEFLFTAPIANVSQNRLIHELQLIPDIGWKLKLLETIRRAYLRAPQFPNVMPVIQKIISFPSQNLAEFLLNSLTAIRDCLNISTELIPTSRVFANADLKGAARCVDICRRLGAKTYVNAPGGRGLYDAAEFQKAGLALRFLEMGQVEYHQAIPIFHPALSIVDVMMFNENAKMRELLSQPTLP